MLQLGAQDSQFLYMESGENLSNVTMVSIYAKPQKPSLDSIFDLVKAHVKSRLHTSAIFSRKLVRVPLDLDYPYWTEDEYFDFESHIQLHRLPAPGDWSQFSELVGRIHSRPLDMNRPIWEIHVIENLHEVENIPPGSFALATKIHHAAVDGASMVKFFSGLSDLDIDGTAAIDLSINAPAAGEPPTSNEMWKRGLVNHIRSPLKLTKTLLRAAPAIVPAAIKALAKSDQDERNKVPVSRFNQTISPRKVFDAVELDLADFKFIQHAFEDTKINDVVLAVCSAGLRKYLITHHDLPQESLVAWVPINARVKTTSSDSTSAGNQITAMTTDLHTDLADPIEQLKHITRQTQMSKAAKSGVSARLMTDVSQHMPGATMALASRIIMASGVAGKLCNLAISNVPGPQVPMYMNGAKCLQQFGMVPLGQGMGLFIVALSYNGKLTLSITTTASIMPDTAFLCECLKSSLIELKQAASKQKKPAKKAALKG